MVIVNYQKRKNTELFKGLENSKSLFLSQPQNYIPIYNRFFSLNETNHNNINLNHRWFITSVKPNDETTIHNIFNCKIKNIDNNKVKEKDVFFKLAPLLDPYKFLVGKYNSHDSKMLNLPKLNSTEDDCNPKMLDVNNSAYVDGFFLFLTSGLLTSHKFVHSVDYYGSYLAIKNNFTLNIFDDIDYLSNSEFFNKNKNVLFTVSDYDHLFENEEPKLKPLIIDHSISAKSQLSVKSFDNELFEDVFVENIIDFTNVELEDLTNVNFLLNKDKEPNNVTLKSNSTCSSRSSHTTDDDTENEIVDNEPPLDTKDTPQIEETKSDDDNENDDDDDDDDDDNDDDYESIYSSSVEEERINVIIPKFPVQVIGMEYCENTFDDLILNNELTTEEWHSAFMQIIMILITYQKAFGFTHNDLHTNNVMYNDTDKKFLFYCYKKKRYKVPTFGRIFKIIDFGRSIYKFDGKVFCSDSFQMGGDAANQYNTEPYLNSKKPRLEPNFSFDLCRLACSIFDYLIEDFEEIKDLSKCKDPIKRLVVEWCLDDKGVNMLYKGNGADRYPEFKLYKMIARCVHNHTPQSQLERPEFNKFSEFKGEINSDIIDIDSIPSYI